jgi:hypothetical protein
LQSGDLRKTNVRSLREMRGVFSYEAMSMPLIVKVTLLPADAKIVHTQYELRGDERG